MKARSTRDAARWATLGDGFQNAERSVVIGIELEPTFTSKNVEAEVKKYTEQIQFLSASVATLNGVALFTALKRRQIGIGPYPDVSLFEAANRIMTDLVILYGVRWLLHNRVFPFSSYAVEYGHSNENDFDITAQDEGQTLIGEAFNVAPSFFQGKKAAMLKKMRRHGRKATHSLVMFNADARSRTIPSLSLVRWPRVPRSRRRWRGNCSLARKQNDRPAQTGAT